jgi:hypothetical protein
MFSDSIPEYPSDCGFYKQTSWAFEYVPILVVEFIGLLGLAAMFAFLSFVKRVLKPNADTNS